MKKELTLNEEIVLGAAFRYALGRMTYVVGSVCEELIKHEPILSENFKTRIAKEIQEHQDEYEKAGMDMDNDEWNYVKWLFESSRRYLIEANYHNTQKWIKCEAVLGENGVYYSLVGKNKHYHTTRNEVKKFPEKESLIMKKAADYCCTCGMIFYNCLCSHEN